MEKDNSLSYTMDTGGGTGDFIVLFVFTHSFMGWAFYCVLGPLSKAWPASSLKSSDGGRKRSLNMMESGLP